MERTSGKKTATIILVILCCVYAAILIVLAPHTVTMWIALVFGLVQALILGLAGLGRSEVGAEGLFKTYPKLIVPAICFAAQILIGCLFSFVMPGDVTVSSVVGIVLLAISIIAFLGTRKTMEYAEQVERKKSLDTFLMESLLLDLQDIQDDVSTDSEIYAELETVIEQLRFSDVRGNANIEPIDNDLAESVELLKHSQVIGKEDIAKVRRLIESRTRRLKASK